MILPIRLYNPKGPDRTAVVSTSPSTGKPGQQLVVVSRGSKGKLGKGTSYGPYPEADLDAHVAAVVAMLEGEGFQRAGASLDLAGLSSKKAAVVARTALTLGWKRDPKAVGPLAAALAGSVDAACSILDALGAIGHPDAIAAVRPYAERKLLSRRRSAVEALRNLNDDEGLAAAITRAKDERLAANVKEALAAGASVDAIAAAIRAVPVRERGLTIDSLYEIATPPGVEAALRVLLEAPHVEGDDDAPKRGLIGAPHVFRYAKSVFKRAMLRFDLRTFGLLAHAIEAEAQSSKGTTASVKSGFDGKQRDTPIFKRGTQHYLRRLSWRWLRRLARYRPASFAHAAAEALVHYGPDDTSEARGLHGDLADCYLVNRILWGKSTRLVFDARSVRVKFRSSKVTAVPPGVREEPYPALWDAEPSAFVRILAAAKLVDAHVFALAGVTRHPDVMKGAMLEDVVAMLGAAHGPTVEVAIAELGRRFDASKPDLALLARLVDDPREVVRELGQRWLRLSAAAWTRSLDHVIAFLLLTDGTSRALACELVLAALPALRPDQRAELASRLATLLRQPEASEGAHDGLGRVAREGLAVELAPLFTVKDLTALLAKGSLAARAVAGALLARHPDALTELGVPGVMAFAEDEVQAVRAAAHALLRTAAGDLSVEPGMLLQLAESRWPDTRGVAFELLRELAGLDELGLDAILGLCDSSFGDAQAMGRELVVRSFSELDPEVVLFRLAEHPHPSMRRFTLELIEKHLRGGFVALARLEEYFRAALFDLMPDRTLKRRIIAFLADRGTVDEQQGELAMRLLGELVRTRTVSDFERIAEALVRIQLAHPGLTSAMKLVSPETAQKAEAAP